MLHLESRMKMSRMKNEFWKSVQMEWKENHVLMQTKKMIWFMWYCNTRNDPFKVCASKQSHLLQVTFNHFTLSIYCITLLSFNSLLKLHTLIPVHFEQLFAELQGVGRNQNHYRWNYHKAVDEVEDLSAFQVVFFPGQPDQGAKIFIVC